MSNPYALSDDMPVYVISVAAQLSGMHPQTLRAYDKIGLVRPGRSQGRGRRYSMRDILALREMHAEVAQLRVELESTRAVAARLAELRRSGSDTRSGRESREGLVPVRSARVAVWEPIAGPAGETGPPRGDK
jgi:MerR family transcriptional regulator/heat shock protein HspR